MFSPGAQRSGLIRPSAVGPRLENVDSKKPFSPTSAIEHTVIAFAAPPGEPIVEAPAPAFPAAPTGTIPASAAAFTARDKASVPSEEPAEPSDRLMIRTL